MRGRLEARARAVDHAHLLEHLQRAADEQRTLVERAEAAAAAGRLLLGFRLALEAAAHRRELGVDGIVAAEADERGARGGGVASLLEEPARRLGQREDEGGLQAGGDERGAEHEAPPRAADERGEADEVREQDPRRDAELRQRRQRAAPRRLGALGNVRRHGGGDEAGGGAADEAAGDEDARRRRPRHQRAAQQEERARRRERALAAGAVGERARAERPRDRAEGGRARDQPGHRRPQRQPELGLDEHERAGDHAGVEALQDVAERRAGRHLEAGAVGRRSGRHRRELRPRHALHAGVEFCSRRRGEAGGEADEERKEGGELRPHR